MGLHLSSVGAIIAFCAVKPTIEANAKNVQDQIGANNKAVQDQIAANAKAVQDQIAANSRAIQDQIDAAAAQQQQNREAEWARLRRKEVLDLVLEAGNMARRLASIARTYSLVTDPELSHGPDDERLKEVQVEEFAELNSPDRLRVVLDKLEMHGLAAVRTSLSALEIEAGAVIQDLDYGEWTITEKEQAVFDAIEDALQEPRSSQAVPE